MFAADLPPRHAAALRLRRPGAVVLVGVLVLHVLLVVVASRLGVWPDRVNAQAPASRAAAPLMLWLLDSARPAPATPATAADAAQARRRRGPAEPMAPEQPIQPGASLPSAARGEPQAITLPWSPSEAPSEAPPAPPRSAKAASTSGSASAALNLALPRAASAAWRQRSPALDDARANTRAPVNLATLIDKALGGDPYGPTSEEHLADGSVRFRRGSQCVIARPNKAQNIDPFNGSVLPKPRLLDAC
jgi:hypothetical protein